MCNFWTSRGIDSIAAGQRGQHIALIFRVSIFRVFYQCWLTFQRGFSPTAYIKCQAACSYVLLTSKLMFYGGQNIIFFRNLRCEFKLEENDSLFSKIYFFFIYSKTSEMRCKFCFVSFFLSFYFLYLYFTSKYPENKDLNKVATKIDYVLYISSYVGENPLDFHRKMKCAVLYRLTISILKLKR